MKKKIEEICNRQIEREAYSSHLYLAMASWAENEGLKGVSDWLYAQSEEERVHMLKFVKFVNERGGKAVIPELKKPPVSFKSVNEIFEETLKHEQYITNSINEIVFLALEEKDFTTHNWVQWFVTEQIEEEASVMEIMDRLKLATEKNLYFFDRDIMAMRGTAGEEAGA